MLTTRLVPCLFLWVDCPVEYLDVLAHLSSEIIPFFSFRDLVARSDAMDAAVRRLVEDKTRLICELNVLLERQPLTEREKGQVISIEARLSNMIRRVQQLQEEVSRNLELGTY